MRTVGLLLAALIALGIITFLCGNTHGPIFAADLSAKTDAALKAAQIAGVMVAGEGQIITLTGQVATEEIKQRAGEEARKIYGVEEVRNLLTVAPPGPPPLTPQQRIEATNCQTEFNKLLLADKIQFQTGSDVISAASHRLLDNLAAAAKKCPDAQIVIEGHTDSKGAHDMNVALSKRRAASVEKYLISKGIPDERTTPEGYGPDRPIGDNNTPAGREKNRRTEFHVQGLQ